MAKPLKYKNLHLKPTHDKILTVNNLHPIKDDLTSIAVVIPFHAINSDFNACLEAILAAKSGISEVILIDDGIVQTVPIIACTPLIKTISTKGKKGPAFARNLGVQAAQSDIICFIDSDVLVPVDLFERIQAVFEKEKDLTALFGSYDDAPGDKGFLSQYRNLLHHFVHQTSNEKASTFWTGCGAIKRSAFLEMQGFNGARYKSPEVEDIDLGYRLTNAGHKIQLVKDLQVKHLKSWTALNLVEADLFHRAVPWTKLILQQGRLLNDLNLKNENKVSVILSFMIPTFLFFAIWNPFFLFPFFGGILFLFALNFPLYHFFYQKRGKRFFLKSLFWHWVFYVVSGIGFIIGFIDYYFTNKSS